MCDKVLSDLIFSPLWSPWCGILTHSCLLLGYDNVPPGIVLPNCLYDVIWPWAWIQTSCAFLCGVSKLDFNPFTAQPVKFPGWKMQGRAHKQYIFRFYNIYFQCYAFWRKSFHMPVWERKQKGSEVSNCALLWVVFKWPHGSDGVNVLSTGQGQPRMNRPSYKTINTHVISFHLKTCWMLHFKMMRAKCFTMAPIQCHSLLLSRQPNAL